MRDASGRSPAPRPLAGGRPLALSSCGSGGAGGDGGAVCRQSGFGRYRCSNNLASVHGVEQYTVHVCRPVRDRAGPRIFSERSSSCDHQPGNGDCDDAVASALDNWITGRQIGGMGNPIPKPGTSAYDYGEWASALHAAYGRGNAGAARAFHVHPTTVWRWRCGRSPLPRGVAEGLLATIESHMRLFSDARQNLKFYLARPAPHGCRAGSRSSA